MFIIYYLLISFLFIIIFSSCIPQIILPTEKLIYLSAIFLFIMGFGSGAIDASLQPMLAQAYDNLLEKKKLEEKSLSLRKDSDTSTTESDVKLIILPNDEKETDIIDLKNDIIERKKEGKEEGENDDTIKEKGDDDDDDDEGEDAHNKYTRVFSLGNMAMNIGFITGNNLILFVLFKFFYFRYNNKNK